MKVAEARELENELQRLRAENVDLRRKVNDFSAVETAKTKAETKVGHLERKVRQRIFLQTLVLIRSLQMEDLIQEKVVQKENELNATYDEKLRNYEDRWACSFYDQ